MSNPTQPQSPPNEVKQRYDALPADMPEHTKLLWIGLEIADLRARAGSTEGWRARRRCA